VGKLKYLQVTIRLARHNESKYLSRLAFRSKASWGYSRHYMSTYRPILKISQKYLSHFWVYVMEDEKKVLGFFSFIPRGTEILLDFFFLDPIFKKQGLGKRMWKAAISVASKNGWKAFQIVSDPHSLGFYIHMGAELVGFENSEAMKMLQLPVLEFKIPERSRIGRAA